MKYTIIAAASLLHFGAVNSVAAYSFSPSKTVFRLNGQVLIKTDGQHGQGRCDSKWIGKTKIDGGELRTFVPIPGGRACKISHTQAIPSPISITGPNSASVTIGWYYSNGAISECAPTPLQITIGSTGIWSFDGPIGVCHISGKLTSTPPITIVP